MAIFISYNHKDRHFVETLAENLVAAKHHIWIDRWELSLGDSLTQKIQGALTKAHAILVILSKNSVESEWCKRELNAGLIRELEEKQTLVMPCVIDTCEIPLFLKDKLYADFRRNPDEAFDLVDRSLARFSNLFSDRAEQPEFLTDWAVAWQRHEIEGDQRMVVEWTFIDHGHEWPYVALSTCEVICDTKTTEKFKFAQRSDRHGNLLRNILSSIIGNVKNDELTVRVGDAFKHSEMARFKDDEGAEFYVKITYQRLGIDSGMDTIIRLGNNLNIALEQMDDKLFDPANASRKA